LCKRGAATPREIAARDIAASLALTKGSSDGAVRRLSKIKAPREMAKALNR